MLTELIAQTLLSFICGVLGMFTVLNLARAYAVRTLRRNPRMFMTGLFTTLTQRNYLYLPMGDVDVLQVNGEKYIRARQARVLELLVFEHAPEDDIPTDPGSNRVPH